MSGSKTDECKFQSMLSKQHELAKIQTSVTISSYDCLIVLFWICYYNLTMMETCINLNITAKNLNMNWWSQRPWFGFSRGPLLLVIPLSNFCNKTEVSHEDLFWGVLEGKYKSLWGRTHPVLFFVFTWMQKLKSPAHPHSDYEWLDLCTRWRWSRQRRKSGEVPKPHIHTWKND